MRIKIFLAAVITLWGMANGASVFAQVVISDKQYNYQLTLPAAMKAYFSNSPSDSVTYYDTEKGVVLMIGGRKGSFKNVESYLDCSRQDLEKDLQAQQGDSTLRLIDCHRSPYYPRRSTVLHFETHAYSGHFERCLVYFFHCYGAELQFFFLYDKTRQGESLPYIDHIMHSLRLRQIDRIIHQ